MLTLLHIYRAAKTLAGSARRAAGAAAGVFRRVFLAAADFSRRLAIYVCLAAVLAADWILDRIDPDDDNRPKPHLA